MGDGVRKRCMGWFRNITISYPNNKRKTVYDRGRAGYSVIPKTKLIVTIVENVLFQGIEQMGEGNIICG